MSTERQIEANRQNALKSTGPNTPEGKAIVSLNALKHGLTADDSVTVAEAAEGFDELRELFLDHYKPATPDEFFLVNRLVVAVWRLRRAVRMETGLFHIVAADQKNWVRKTYGHLGDTAILANVLRHDSANSESLPRLSRNESKLELSYYRALHELQRFQARRAAERTPLPEAPEGSS